MHYSHILEHRPKLSLFRDHLGELHGDSGRNWHGRPSRILEKVIRADYPIVMHGVSMSIGIVRSRPARLSEETGRRSPTASSSQWISDHFCWTGVNGENLHDLLPLPYTEETVRHA